MSSELLKGLCRIYCHSSDGAYYVSGTGILLGPFEVVTCAHLISAPHRAGGEATPSGDLKVDFPFAGGASTWRASVKLWLPDEDVAVLKLSAPAPPDACDAVFIADSNVQGHAVRVFGFPSGFSEGVWAAGMVAGRTANGQLQIDTNSEVGYGIQPGFSGGPVLDIASGGVIGIIAARDASGRAAFVIPSSTLARSVVGITLHPGQPSPRVVEHIQVFLCHASDDKPAVRNLYRQLKGDGIRPWLDELDILPGKKWDLEIRKAVRASQAILICLSNRSVSKSGYVQKEIKIALDIADEKPDDVIFLIPVRLEECAVPDRLGAFQWVNLYSDDGYERLLESLRLVSKTMSPSEVA